MKERPPRSGTDSERPVRPRGTAKDRALRLLGVRDRSRRELERRLLRAGFEPEVVGAALDDLAAAGLIDDQRFAAAVAEHARAGRIAGRRAVMSSLMAAGVDRDTAEQAVEPLGEGETERAQALADRQAARLRGVEPEKAFRRISGLLLRRGFAPSTAFSVARRALGNPEDETT
jgi:regulatory protein